MEGRSDDEDPAPDDPIPEGDIGPYGLRGEHTPPLGNMFGGYAIIFAAVILIPLVVFAIVRFVVL